MSPFHWIAAAIVIVFSSARLTRLATYDLFPPVKWFRDEYIEWTDKTDRRRPWQLLAFCGYCASFWITGAVVAWADLSGVFDGKPVADWMTPLWWIANGTLAASYVAAIVMAYDGDPGDDHEDEI